jgi:hypothetical protein
MWLFLSLLSSIGFAAMFLLARGSKGIPATVVTTAYALWGPVVLLYSIREVSFPWSETWWQIFLPLPLLIMPLALLALTMASQRTPVTIMKPLSAFSPLAALFFSIAAYGAVFPPLGIAGIFTVTLGLLVLYHGRWKAWKEPWPWVAVLGMIILGINASVTREVLLRFPEPLAVVGLAATGTFCINAILSVPYWKKTTFSLNTVLLLCFFVGIDFLQSFATIAALELAPSAYVIAVKRTSILLASIGAFYIFNEKDQPLWQIALSCAIVIVGVTMLAL